MSIDDQGYCFENLKQNQLYFNKPKNFNDPFDGTYPTVLKNISDEQLIDDMNLFYDSHKITNKKMSLNEYRCELDLSDITKQLNKLKENFSNSHGVTCFSETKNNILMWSHYANSHSGLCLKFSTSNKFFDKLKAVEYIKKIPEFNSMNFLNENMHKGEIIQIFCTKYWDWKYEKECRLFMSKADQAYPYPKECLTGIYLGLKIKPEVIKDIKSICPDVPIHKARKSETEFKVEFDLI